MGFNITRILKGLLLREAGVLSPKEIEITPAGSAGTKTSIVSSQTANRTITIPDATDTLVGKATVDVFTNKTIDVDAAGNDITNLVDANIKAAAAIAVSKLAAQTASRALASDASGFIVPSATTATELGYVNGVTSAIQTQLNTDATNLSNHLADTIDAHDASAISNIPSGNLAATEVQAALNELQTDIDTRATSTALSDHLNDTVDAHDASAISFVAVGTIAATDAQTAIAEVATDAASALSTHEADTTSIHGITDTSLLLTTTNAKVVTAKDIDGGTASNTSRITIPKDTKANLDALTRKEATVVFGSDTDKLYVDNGSSLVSVGSGGGTVNFITNGSADDATATIFTAYKDAAATRPVDGTGGAPTVISSNITSTAPLKGTKSFTIAHTAANGQGEGVAVLLDTLTPAYFAKVLQINIDYIVNSGTFQAGSSTQDSDLIWYLYDVTNSTLIEPSSIKMLSNSSTISDRFQATFQTSATGTSYRLIAHCATTNAVAFAIKCEVEISPSTYVYGTPITDWATTTVTCNFTNQVTLAKKRRVGDSMEYAIQTKFSAAPAAVSYAIWTLPDTIDVSKLAQGSASTVDARGPVNIYDASAGTTYTGVTSVSSSTTITMETHGALGSVDELIPITFALNDYIETLISVPILGQSSSVQMSDQTDTRVVAASITSTDTPTFATATTTKTTWSTTVRDTHGMVDLTNDRINVTVAGDYLVSMNYLFASIASTAVDAIQVYARVNNSTLYNVGTFGFAVATQFRGVSGSVLVPNLKTGDYVEIVVNQNIVATLTAYGGFNNFTMTKISGPSAIAATETIKAKYRYTANFTSSPTIPINFGTKVYDSHGAVTTSATAWKFTAPVAGLYTVLFSQNSGGAAVSTQLYKNGSVVEYFFTHQVAAGNGYLSGGTEIELIAGDYIDIRHDNSGASSGGHVCIKKSGN